jgi:hypothetical protein
MKRSVTTTRLYSLGNYQNISFTDTIEDIPEEVALDNKAMGLLRSIQLFQIERSYLKYFKLKETTHKLSNEEAMELIDELDVTSSKKFNELFYRVPQSAEDTIED